MCVNFFVAAPLNVECVITLGALLCWDSFLSICTVWPLRFIHQLLLLPFTLKLSWMLSYDALVVMVTYFDIFC